MVKRLGVLSKSLSWNLESVLGVGGLFPSSNLKPLRYKWALSCGSVLLAGRMWGRVGD